MATSARTTRGLDWLFFFVADLQTGFGPFIAVYLTSHQWTQAELGVALGVGSMASMIAQVPGGAIVDALRNKALAAGVALAGIGLSALLMAASADLWPVLLAQALYGLASCMLNPALAAVTLGLVSVAAVPERFGRNARFAAIGSALGAVLMGACGTFVSTRSVFWLAAGLCLPAMLALWATGRTRALVDTPVAAPVAAPDGTAQASLRTVVLDRRLIAYLGCTFLFQLSNAAMLPLAGVEITKRAEAHASLIIAACILVPQMMVAALSPLAGRVAERWGRRSVLFVGFCALPLRALLLSLVTDPLWIVPIQALDGLGGAAFGVMSPLIAADISGNDGRFNLRMGILGLAVGLAATLSNTVAGGIASDLGTTTAFMALSLVGVAAVVMVGVGMPETRPRVAGMPLSVTG